MIQELWPVNFYDYFIMKVANDIKLFFYLFHKSLTRKKLLNNNSLTDKNVIILIFYKNLFEIINLFRGSRFNHEYYQTTD